MCPHCIAAAIGAVAISLPAIPFLKSKLSWKKKVEYATR